MTPDRSKRRIINHLRTAVLNALLVLVFFVFADAQSVEQAFPTPITTNELRATIEPRSVGDARLTSYYYAFDGTQGDIFVNVVSKNLNGDIDIFVRDGLRLLSKIVVYADVGDGETGRVVYLRKPEKLLLRIQGRSPNDDPATVQIKFAGSFVAAAAADVPEPPRVAKRSTEAEPLTALQKDGSVAPPADVPIEVAKAEKETEKAQETSENPSPDVVQQPKMAAPGKTVRNRVIVESTLPDPMETTTASTGAAARKTPADPKLPATKPSSSRRNARTVRSTERDSGAQPSTDPETAPTVPEAETRDPMADFRLVIVFKDDSRVERPMTEILRFTVDRGVLTVVDRSGRIGRYSMADIKRVGIE